MKNKTILIIVTISGIFLLVLFYILGQLGRKIPENNVNVVGNTAGNLYNGGMFCEDDGYVYFSNAYDNYALYRMLPNETEMEKLISTQTKNINAAGKYFYYYQFGSGDGEGLGYVIDTTGIYRAEKKNARKSTCLHRALLDTMVLAGNHIIYDYNGSNGVVLQKIDIDGKNGMEILPYKVTPAYVDNGKMYFNDTSDDFHLNAMEISSLASGNPRIFELYTEDVYMPLVEENDIYYIDIHNNYALVRYNLVSQEKIVLDNTRTDMFNISKNYVYYQTSGDNPQFKRVAKDGSSMDVIADGAYNTINITSRYVYFTEFNSELPVYKIPLDGNLAISTFDAAREAAYANMKK